MQKILNYTRLPTGFEMGSTPLLDLGSAVFIWRKYEICLVEYELILNIHKVCWGTFIPVICIIRLTTLPLIQIPFSAALYNIRSPNKILT